MSDKGRVWVWELNLPPARKLVMLWLAWRATDNGVAFPGEREMREKTGLGERMVRYHLQGLAAEHLDGPDANPGPLLVRIERPIRAGRNTSNVYVLRVPWAEPTAVRRDLEELKHIPDAALNEVLASVGVGATGCSPVAGRSSPRNRHPDTPPAPLVGAQQRQQQQGLSDDATNTARDRPSDPRQLADARKLAEVFYRGLGGEVTAVTVAVRRRDLVIASDLVAAGATPSEAEAYAVEMKSVGRRIAPVDLRSFERERLGWLAPRRPWREPWFRRPHGPAA